jgi:hypothetical protein
LAKFLGDFALGGVMVFEDNFFEVLPGWLIDPVLKLRLNTSKDKEYGLHLNLWYDPTIDPNHLVRMPTPEEHARYLSEPYWVKLADKPILVTGSSENTIKITSFALRWDEPQDGVWRIKITNDWQSYQSKGSLFLKEKAPVAQDSPNGILLYMAQSLIKFSEINCLGKKVISERYPDVRRLESCIHLDVAERYFGLNFDQYEEVEPGWVRVGAREIGQ